jgi:hypothetical protein
VARNRYIEAVQEYNVTVREFPTNLTAKMFDYDVKPNFTVENEAAVSSAPAVTFDTTTPSKAGRRGRARAARQPAAGELGRVKAALAWLAFALIAGFAPPASAQVPVPKFEARVTDLTGTLTAQQQASLEEKLAAFEARKGAQVAGAHAADHRARGHRAVRHPRGRRLEGWARRTDDGVILIVAKNDRALRIEVGRGLEGALTDVTSSRIIEETITPLFKQGDFFGGINAGLDQMLRVIDGEPLPAPIRRGSPKTPTVCASPWRSSR